MDTFTVEKKKIIMQEIKNISYETIQNELQQLVNIGTTNIEKVSSRCRLGNNIVDYFTFYERLHTKGKYGIHFFQFVENIEEFKKKKFIANLFQYLQTNVKKPRKHFYAICKYIYNLSINCIFIIRPLVYMEIYTKYRPRRILDFCAGWGGAALAAAILINDTSSELISYTGIDMNTNLQIPYEKMLAFLKEELFYNKNTKDNNNKNKIIMGEENIKMIFADALTVDYSAMEYDFVFTSPPYYFIQKYENNKEYKNKKEMNEHFYRPLFTRTFAGLQPNGIYAINVCKEVFTSVLVELLGPPNEIFSYKKSHRQKKHEEMIYLWRKCAR